MIEFKNLPYSKRTLQPTITKETIEFHYEKHYKGYLDKLNNFIKSTHYDSLSLEDIVKKSYMSNDIKIFNNAAQVWNHEFYWDSIKENEIVKNEHNDKLDQKKKLRTDYLLNKIIKSFNSVEGFYKQFIEAGITLFGSGWIWLVQDPKSKELEIMQTYNADTPILHNKIAILTIDVWEHAYYLDYQNNRLNYLQNIINNHLNWKFAQNNIKM